MSSQPTTTAIRKFVLTALAVVSIASLAACASTADTSTSPTDSVTGDEITDITVLRSTGNSFEPLYIAQEQGFFTDARLNVTIKVGAADTSANVPSIVNNEAQFAMTDSSGFIKGVAAGLPVLAVAQLQASDASADPSDGLILAADSPIQRFKDLEGKTVGLPSLGSTVEMATDYFVKKDGGDPTKINFVSLPLPTLNEAVASGQVDAGYTFSVFYDAAKADGMRVLGKGTNEIDGLPQALLFASADYLAANADSTERFVAAMTKAIDYANANPDAIRAVDAAQTTQTAEQIAARSIQPLKVSFIKSAMDTVIETQVEFHLIPTAPSGSVFWSGAPMDN